MKLNSLFIANINDIHGEVGIAWLNALPAYIKTLSAQWDLKSE